MCDFVIGVNTLSCETKSIFYVYTIIIINNKLEQTNKIKDKRVNKERFKGKIKRNKENKDSIRSFKDINEKEDKRVKGVKGVKES